MNILNKYILADFGAEAPKNHEQLNPHDNAVPLAPFTCYLPPPPVFHQSALGVKAPVSA
jgi:hypothetical protein